MKGINNYPGEMVMRNNYFAPMYCEMAMESFYDLIKKYKELRQSRWLVPADEEFALPEYIHKKAATTVIFSAIAAEAFINNYLAIRMGDVAFLDQFDGKSYVVKLHHLMMLVQARNKDAHWYKDLRELFSIRNEYVHSYSSETPVEYLLEKIQDKDEREKAAARVEAVKEKDPANIYAQYRAVFFGNDDDDDHDSGEWTPEITDSDLRLSANAKSNIKACVKDARLAMVALCNFTRYVNHNDPNTHAFSFTFTPPDKYGLEGYKKEIRETAFDEIKTYMQNRA